MATLGLAVNLVTYFMGVMHFSVADAANNLTNFMGTSYLITILVAFLADTYVGRFKAVLFATSVEFLVRKSKRQTFFIKIHKLNKQMISFKKGLGLLAVQAHFPKLKPPFCNIYDPKSNCIKVTGSNATLLFVGLYLVGIGSGGIKAALPSHGADQFDDKDPKEEKQKSSFFNWLLLSLCLGGAFSLTFFVWIQDHKGWDWGFTVSTIAMFFAVLIFAAGLPHYRIHVINGRSALTEIVQVSIKTQSFIKFLLFRYKMCTIPMFFPRK